MTKTEFLQRLAKLLRGMDPEDLAQWLAYYSEMIDDYMEEGHTETVAVGMVGSVEALARQIRTDAGLPANAAETEQSARRKWLIGLCTAPLWLPVVLAAGIVALAVAAAVAAVVFVLVLGVLAVVLAVCGTAISLVIALYGAVVGLIAGGLGIALSGVVMLFSHPLQGLFTFGAGLVLIGLALPTLLLCIALQRLLKTCFHKIVQLIRALVPHLPCRKECHA
jgi:uncharacterized membrane protein